MCTAENISTSAIIIEVRGVILCNLQAQGQSPLSQSKSAKTCQKKTRSDRSFVAGSLEVYD